MASWTTYTSTMTVPVYASWKCEHCGEVNFSAGAIACKREETTSSWRNSRHEEAKSKAHQRAQAEWAGNAYKIIKDPNHNAQSVRSDLSLQNTRCTKCGKKPKWDKDMKYLGLCGLCLMPAIISGIVAISSATSLVAWLVFAALLSAVVYGFVTEAKYKKMMAALSKEYTPVIGSLNAELIEYANHLGTSIPSPDESIELVRGYGKKHVSAATIPTVVEEPIASAVEDANTEPAGFCRKCCAQLQVGSGFCHKCGTEVIK